MTKGRSLKRENSPIMCKRCQFASRKETPLLPCTLITKWGSPPRSAKSACAAAAQPCSSCPHSAPAESGTTPSMGLVPIKFLMNISALTVLLLSSLFLFLLLLLFLLVFRLAFWLVVVPTLMNKLLNRICLWPAMSQSILLRPAAPLPFSPPPRAPQTLLAPSRRLLATVCAIF